MAAKKKSTSNFNLAHLDTVTASKRGVNVEIKHPVTREPIVVNEDTGAKLVFRVSGPDSPEFKHARNEYLKRYLKRSNETGQKALDAIDLENYEDDNFELVWRSVIGWENLYFDPDSEGVKDVDEPLEFSKENSRMVLESCPWIVEQLQLVIGNRANFIGK